LHFVNVERSAVLLDNTPLSMILSPAKKPEFLQIKTWLQSLLASGITVLLPEIIDYELRRAYLRVRNDEAIRALDRLKMVLFYDPITTDLMLRAAWHWADVRQKGLATAHEEALDGDAILAAHAFFIENNGYEAVVATANVKHLQRFGCRAYHWHEIEVQGQT
jgi:predicted nucleic acid-binding protein